MKIAEVLNSRVDLAWDKQGDDYYTTFKLEDREYGISVQTEEVQNLQFARVDFHFVDESGKVHHEATGFNKDAGKVLGIVGNGVAERFKVDCFYFIAKGDQNFDGRVKLYTRLAGKLAVRENLRKKIILEPDHAVFILSKDLATEEIALGFV